jgi:putative FmdB family regulatory protein
MPIYEYQCGSCGSKKEYLQKLSDEPIPVCPTCGSNTYTKLISAAGFQLKGSGWYATDFKNGSQSKPKTEPKEKNESMPGTKPKTTPDTAPKASVPSTTK